MAVERKRKERREKVNDYSGTIVSERRRWRTHTLGPILNLALTMLFGLELFPIGYVSN
jgi:hypothetical protein